MLVLMVLPLAVGTAIVGLRRGGSRGFVLPGLRHVWLIWVAAMLQFVRYTDPGWAAPLLKSRSGLWPVVVMFALACTFVAINVAVLPGSARPGLVIFGVGFTLNSVTMALNGGMPFSVAAARASGLPKTVNVPAGPGHVPLTSHTNLPFFADILPVPIFQRVVSVGDLLILLGATWLVVALIGAARTVLPRTATHT